jgi:hypothetical protein
VAGVEVPGVEEAGDFAEGGFGGGCGVGGGGEEGGEGEGEEEGEVGLHG